MLLLINNKLNLTVLTTVLLKQASRVSFELQRSFRAEATQRKPGQDRQKYEQTNDRDTYRQREINVAALPVHKLTVKVYTCRKWLLTKCAMDEHLILHNEEVAITSSHLILQNL